MADDNEHPVTSSGKTFPAILRDILDDGRYNDIVHWGEKASVSGQFVIADLDRFTSEILTRFYRCNLGSFIRQLNAYGFKRERTKTLSWFHPLFLRNRPELISAINRRSTQFVRANQALKGHSDKAADEILQMMAEAGALKGGGKASGAGPAASGDVSGGLASPAMSGPSNSLRGGPAGAGAPPASTSMGAPAMAQPQMGPMPLPMGMMNGGMVYSVPMGILPMGPSQMPMQNPSQMASGHNAAPSDYWGGRTQQQQQQQPMPGHFGPGGLPPPGMAGFPGGGLFFPMHLAGPQMYMGGQFMMPGPGMMPMPIPTGPHGAFPNGFVPAPSNQTLQNSIHYAPLQSGVVNGRPLPPAGPTRIAPGSSALVLGRSTASGADVFKEESAGGATHDPESASKGGVSAAEQSASPQGRVVQEELGGTSTVKLSGVEAEAFSSKTLESMQRALVQQLEAQGITGSQVDIAALPGCALLTTYCRVPEEVLQRRPAGLAKVVNLLAALPAPLRDCVKVEEINPVLLALTDGCLTLESHCLSPSLAAPSTVDLGLTLELTGVAARLPLDRSRLRALVWSTASKRPLDVTSGCWTAAKGRLSFRGAVQLGPAGDLDSLAISVGLTGDDGHLAQLFPWTCFAPLVPATMARELANHPALASDLAAVLPRALQHSHPLPTPLEDAALTLAWNAVVEHLREDALRAGCSEVAALLTAQSVPAPAPLPEVPRKPSSLGLPAGALKGLLAPLAGGFDLGSAANIQGPPRRDIPASVPSSLGPTKAQTGMVAAALGGSISDVSCQTADYGSVAQTVLNFLEDLENEALRKSGGSLPPWPIGDSDNNKYQTEAG